MTFSKKNACVVGDVSISLYDIPYTFFVDPGSFGKESFVRYFTISRYDIK